MAGANNQYLRGKTIFRQWNMYRAIFKKSKRYKYAYSLNLNVQILRRLHNFTFFSMFHNEDIDLKVTIDAWYEELSKILLTLCRINSTEKRLEN